MSSHLGRHRTSPEDCHLSPPLRNHWFNKHLSSTYSLSGNSEQRRKEDEIRGSSCSHVNHTIMQKNKFTPINVLQPCKGCPGSYEKITGRSISYWSSGTEEASEWLYFLETKNWLFNRVTWILSLLPPLPPLFFFNFGYKRENMKTAHLKKKKILDHKRLYILLPNKRDQK